jgi:integrase
VRAFNTDPTQPIKSLKEAWENAKEKAGVECRFHDLRHTCTTRMLERGVPLPVVASILGWSAATTVRMAKRYGHIGQVAQRQAVDALMPPPQPPPKDDPPPAEPPTERPH